MIKKNYTVFTDLRNYSKRILSCVLIKIFQIIQRNYIAQLWWIQSNHFGNKKAISIKCDCYVLTSKRKRKYKSTRSINLSPQTSGNKNKQLNKNKVDNSCRIIIPNQSRAVVSKAWTPQCKGAYGAFTQGWS